MPYYIHKSRCSRIDIESLFFWRTQMGHVVFKGLMNKLWKTEKIPLYKWKNPAILLTKNLCCELVSAVSWHLSQFNSIWLRFMRNFAHLRGIATKKLHHTSTKQREVRHIMNNTDSFYMDLERRKEAQRSWRSMDKAPPFLWMTNSKVVLSLKIFLTENAFLLSANGPGPQCGGW